ncbi:MAG: cation transporter [Clostridia bacterium]|nr:cation transporter [Clostridia bacterium]
MKVWLADGEKRTILWLVLSGISLLISFFNILGDALPVDVAWVAIVLCGMPIILGAVKGLITEFDIKADVLVSIALVAAVFIGEVFAAGEVAFIMAIGALLEERTVAKARAGIEKLVHLTPRTARVIRDGIESIMPAEEVVFSGTVNQFGTFEMKAIKVGENSSLQRMIRLVESADASKAKIVGLADRWATWIVVIALTAAAGTWFVTGEVIRSVTILVVFCPCALVLATPTAIMAGIGNATKYGILIREGDALERLAKVKHMAFDKTGTLTYGKPSVTAVQSLNGHRSIKDLLVLTASAELRSEHPLGKAIITYFKSETDTLPRAPEEFEMFAGRGVRAVLGEKIIHAGNTKLLVEQGISLPQVAIDQTQVYEKEGCSIIYVAVNHTLEGFVALSDTLRKDANQVVNGIQASGLKVLLLTGDSTRAASHMAKLTGITTVHTQCLPEDKLAIIESYQSTNEMVCMVGDGVNDAPALKKAYVGIAMGGIGSDIAVDAADIALVGDDIKHIPHLIRLSKQTMGTIKLNLILSMALNFIAILLAMTGLLNPIMGALVHNVGSVAVIINSSLLLHLKEEKL